MLLLKLEPCLLSLGSSPYLSKASSVYIFLITLSPLSYQKILYYLVEEIACNEKVNIETFRDYIRVEHLPDILVEYYEFNKKRSIQYI
jgi:hypothetical protein